MFNFKYIIEVIVLFLILEKKRFVEPKLEESFLVQIITTYVCTVYVLYCIAIYILDLSQD